MHAAISTMLSTTEFWSAIAGAIAGGLIAYVIQWQSLREGRRQRNADHKKTQQALGYSLLFKMTRILTGFHGIHRHIEECFEEAAAKGLGGEPWSFVVPLANPPEPIHFSADEMGMLLAQKDDDTFNVVVSMDVVHNSLIEAVKVMNTERRALGEQFKPQAVTVDGAVVSGVLGRDQALALRPRMIEVNSLIDVIRKSARTDLLEANGALSRLSKVLREKLGLSHKLELKVELPREQNTRDRSQRGGA